jgi:CBS domain-containing protein
MKIKDIMTVDPKTCTPETSLATAAHLMLEGDCGILPVVEDGRIVGVVTDRDMYIALATMKAHRVRRLPVVGFGDTVVGIVSMNDLLLASGPRKAIRESEVVDTLQAICQHHHPAPHVVAA